VVANDLMQHISMLRDRNPSLSTAPLTVEGARQSKVTKFYAPLAEPSQEQSWAAR